MSSDELHVISTAAKHSRALVGPSDAGTTLLPIHMKKRVFVVAEVMADTHRVRVLLDRERFSGIAAHDLMKLGHRLGKCRGHAEVLHIAAHQCLVDIRRDVPPLRCFGMCTADEHTRGGWQRLIAHGRTISFSGSSADECAITVIDEAGLIDAGLRCGDAWSTVVARRRRCALHNCSWQSRGSLLDERPLSHRGFLGSSSPPFSIEFAEAPNLPVHEEAEDSEAAADAQARRRQTLDTACSRHE